MLGSPGATSTVCLCLLNDQASRKIDPSVLDSMNSSSNHLGSMDLASWPMGLVQLLVLAELLVGIRKRLESQVVAGQCPLSATSLATGPQFGVRLLPTSSMAAVVVAGMMKLAAELAAWLQLVAAPPPRSLLAAAQVVQAQEQPVVHC